MKVLEKIVLLLPCCSLAATLVTGSNETMNMEPGARSAALGSATMAVDGDYLGLVSNPYQLANVRYMWASFSHTAYYEDTQYDYASVTVPLGLDQGLGISFARFGAPEVSCEVNYDTELREEVCRIAEQTGLPAGTLGERDKNLDHGVMVPLYFIMQKYTDFLKKSISPKIKIASFDEYDIQELMRSARMMITDFSSVYFDMIYMKKPVLFYQFDEKQFRQHHYQEGWFDYHNNPFGKSFSEYKPMLAELEKIIKAEYCVSKEYLAAHRKELTNWDRNNSERVYQLLKSNHIQ